MGFIKVRFQSRLTMGGREGNLGRIVRQSLPQLSSGRRFVAVRKSLEIKATVRPRGCIGTLQIIPALTRRPVATAAGRGSPVTGRAATTTAGAAAISLRPFWWTLPV